MVEGWGSEGPALVVAVPTTAWAGDKIKGEDTIIGEDNDDNEDMDDSDGGGGDGDGGGGGGLAWDLHTRLGGTYSRRGELDCLDCDLVRAIVESV